ncbi:hypothetical protein [Anaeromicropila populeti]|uniref:DZANK-type domain-containing protein n=1 Tax=Anaeromicropila populeti TaxID=37658 RepID=A0A1I6LR45_9FIRM|nr:hypothetical protein [Anaeromicropila populeti]SFS05931.1 hypothetical protein SAMN05661086_03497 [Anaeromicropila populeti]
MAGKLCPNCNQYTFFETATGRKCTKCNYEMTVPSNSGKGGKGQKCPNCNKYTVFNNKCSSCGAKFSKNDI